MCVRCIVSRIFIFNDPGVADKGDLLYASPTKESIIGHLAKFFVTFFLLINASGCGTVNMKSEKFRSVEAEVLDAFKGLVDASTGLDANRYFEYFDKEKFTGLNADGKVWHSIKNLEDLIVPGFSAVEKSISLEFFNVKVTVINPTTAILVNEFKQSILLKDGSVLEQSGGGTQVWSRSESVWKLVSVSASNASH